MRSPGDADRPYAASADPSCLGGGGGAAGAVGVWAEAASGIESRPRRTQARVMRISKVYDQPVQGDPVANILQKLPAGQRVGIAFSGGSADIRAPRSTGCAARRGDPCAYTANSRAKPDELDYATRFHVARRSSPAPRRHASSIAGGSWSRKASRRCSAARSTCRPPKACPTSTLTPLWPRHHGIARCSVIAMKWQDDVLKIWGRAAATFKGETTSSRFYRCSSPGQSAPEDLQAQAD